MLNSKKILVSLVIITLLVVAFGSINSLATSITADVNGGGNTITISNSTGAATNSATNSASNTASNNTAATNNAVNNTASNNVVNKVTNSSSYNTTNTNSTKKSSLPYAGTDSNIIFIVIALVVSAIYAYKKVSDYNV